MPCACVRGGSRRQDHRGRGLGTEGEISGLIQSLAFDVEDLETDGENQPADGRRWRGRRTKGWDDEGKKSDPYSLFNNKDRDREKFLNPRLTCWLSDSSDVRVVWPAARSVIVNKYSKLYVEKFLKDYMKIPKCPLIKRSNF